MKDNTWTSHEPPNFVYKPNARSKLASFTNLFTNDQVTVFISFNNGIQGKKDVYTKVHQFELLRSELCSKRQLNLIKEFFLGISLQRTWKLSRVPNNFTRFFLFTNDLLLKICDEWIEFGAMQDWI